MRIFELTRARIALLGFGVEGRATLDSLRAAGLTGEVCLLGDSPPEDGAALGARGVRYADTGVLRRIDVVIRSPGFAPRHPLRKVIDRSGVRQTTASDVFMHEARAAGVQVVGVTGSKGKSTSSALLHSALGAAGVRARLVGNIGVPALSELPVLIRERAVAVLELSSYQCADLTLGPAVAVLLSLFPEHMDWHGGVEPYYAAKLRIAETQHPGDRFFYERGCAQQVARAVPGGQAIEVGGPQAIHFRSGWFCRGAEPLFSDAEMQLPGLHNRRNACCALAAAEAVGGTAEGVRHALQHFSGLPYRLQDEGTHGGIRWINDAIATAPEAVVAALSAFAREPTALILGGYDRGYGTGALLMALQDSPVRVVVTLPDSGRAVGRAIRAAGLAVRVLDAQDLAQAVALASTGLPSGGTCLFSPGAPSYGQYRNFAERGAAFSRLIRLL